VAGGPFSSKVGLRNMMTSQSSGFKIALALACALSLAACSKKNTAAGLNGGGLGAGDGAELSGGAAQVPGSEADFAANVGDKVYFENDQSSLTAEGRETLLKQANWLQQYPQVSIQIEGHADERGTREYNISLSARRATTVRNFLISQGISKDRVSSIAYGKERPAANCDQEECWSQNRRAVTVITDGARTS
jgi:peptidoglycan-associated lipoprotein